MRISVIAFRNIRRNKRRSILSGVAIAISVMSIVILFSVEDGIMSDYGKNIRHFITGDIRIRNEKYDRYEVLNPLHLGIGDYERVVDVCDSDENVRAVLPRIEFYASVYRNGKTFKVVGVGLNFNRAEAFQNFGKNLKSGILPVAGRKEVLLSFGLAKEMGVSVGDRITLLSKDVHMRLSRMSFKITGIVRFEVNSFNKRFLFIPLETVQRFLKMENSVTEILILVRDRSKLQETASRIASLLGKKSPATRLEVRTWRSIGSWYALIKMSNLSYQFMALIFFILGSTVIINTTMMVIYERTREIGTIAAMGMTSSQIVMLFFLEAFFIAVISAFVGALVGMGIVLPFVKDGFDLSNYFKNLNFEVSGVIRPVVNLKTTLFVFVYGVVVASLASFIPSRRAAKIEPVEALRSV